MPSANCSTNSLLANLILHLSCQNCEVHYLHVTSSVNSSWLLLSHQAGRQGGFSFFSTSAGFGWGFVFLSFQTFVFDPTFCYGTWVWELALPQHSQTGQLDVLWGALRRLTMVRASLASLTHLSPCLGSARYGADSFKHRVQYKNPENMWAPAGLVFVCVCFHQ